MPPGARLVLKRPVTINVPKIVRSPKISTAVTPEDSQSSPLAEFQSETPPLQSSALQPSVNNGVTNEVSQSPIVMTSNDPEPVDNAQPQQSVSIILLFIFVIVQV